jgi:hypothetical protein
VLVKNPNLNIPPPKDTKNDKPKGVVRKPDEDKPHTHPPGFVHDGELAHDVDLIRPDVIPTRFDNSQFASILEWEIYVA